MEPIMTTVYEQKHLTPLQAIRKECLDCCNGSKTEVRLCETKGCASWPYRFGRKPTEELYAEVRDVALYPLEAEQTGADVEGRSALQAIKSKCLDCSGGCHSEVRNCEYTDCALYRYRLGKSGRQLSDEQRAAAAERASGLAELRARNEH